MELDFKSFDMYLYIRNLNNIHASWRIGKGVMVFEQKHIQETLRATLKHYETLNEYFDTIKGVRWMSLPYVVQRQSSATMWKILYSNVQLPAKGRKLPGLKIRKLDEIKKRKKKYRQVKPKRIRKTVTRFTIWGRRYHEPWKRMVEGLEGDEHIMLAKYKQSYSREWSFKVMKNYIRIKDIIS